MVNDGPAGSAGVLQVHKLIPKRLFVHGGRDAGGVEDALAEVGGE